MPHLHRHVAQRVCAVVSRVHSLGWMMSGSSSVPGTTARDLLDVLIQRSSFDRFRHFELDHFSSETRPTDRVGA